MNCGPLVSQITALPTEALPLPLKYFSFKNSSLRKTICFVFVVPSPTLVPVMWSPMLMDPPENRRIPIIQSLSCNRKYLSLFIATVGLPFFIFSLFYLAVLLSFDNLISARVKIRHFNNNNNNARNSQSISGLWPLTKTYGQIFQDVKFIWCPNQRCIIVSYSPVTMFLTLTIISVLS